MTPLVHQYLSLAEIRIKLSAVNVQHNLEDQMFDYLLINLSFHENLYLRDKIKHE